MKFLLLLLALYAGFTVIALRGTGSLPRGSRTLTQTSKRQHRVTGRGSQETDNTDPDVKHGWQRMLQGDRCTSIAAGPKAMEDGSTVTTHNNDCQECDIRLTHVPARDWPVGGKRPIYAVRNAYPRYVHTADENIHGPDYLLDKVDTSIYNWTVSKPIMYIDQVSHTYAYTLGAYGLQNEKQVSMGESTCSSKFVAAPIYAGGRAAMHMETLTEIALERCDTARCAVKLMGDLSVQYGFYGPEWDDELEFAQDEAGEAMTVSDPFETWMFHVLPDDTGSSAVWAAQRVPDDHITAVANQFVIQEVDLSNTRDFMASANLHQVAERNHFWSPADGKLLHFSNTYGNDRKSTAYACTRRVWRVFTLAAPSLLPTFTGYTNGMATYGFGVNLSQPYPFSVKPDKPLSIQDIMNINRDQYEGSEFDLTRGTDAGPFGDPMRYAPAGKSADPEEGLTADQFNSGLGFHRPISLFRTAYSSITQARSSLPDTVGAVTWIAQYAPHHASFLPIYASAPSTPSSLNTGTQYRLDKASNYWIHCLTGNYLSRWYIHTIGDVKSFQRRQEAFVFVKQAEAEAAAVALHSSSPSKAAQALGQFHDLVGRTVRDAWWDFFFTMAGTYRDLYKIDMPHQENFGLAFTYLSVPRWWFEQIGYWGAPGTPPPDDPHPRPINPINVPSPKSLQDLNTKYHGGMGYIYPSPYSEKSDYSVAGAVTLNTLLFFTALSAVLGVVAGAAGLWLFQKFSRGASASGRGGAYLPIN